MRRYWLILSPTEPLAVAEIAKKASRKQASAYAPLKRLEVLGLIAKKGKGYVRIEDKAAHDEAAKLRGSIGRGERRKLIHALQREGWKLERQRRTDARVAEAKRLKLKDQLSPANDQATQNGTKSKQATGSKLNRSQVQNQQGINQRSRPLRV